MQKIDDGSLIYRPRPTSVADEVKKMAMTNTGGGTDKQSVTPVPAPSGSKDVGGAITTMMRPIDDFPDWPPTPTPTPTPTPEPTPTPTPEPTPTPTPEPTPTPTPEPTPTPTPTPEPSTPDATPTPVPDDPLTPAPTRTERAPLTDEQINAGVTDEQTVGYYLDKYLSDDSPLIINARANATKKMADRGLQNSTSAISAGEYAAIQSAAPLAAQDAQTAKDHALQNKDAFNQQKARDDQAYENALNRSHEETMTRLQSSLQEKRDQLNHQYKMDEIGQSAALELQRMAKAQEYTLNQISAQANENMKSQYANSTANLIQQGMDEIGDIYSNPEMTPAQQQAAVRDLMNRVESNVSDIQGIYGEFINQGTANGP